MKIYCIEGNYEDVSIHSLLGNQESKKNNVYHSINQKPLQNLKVRALSGNRPVSTLSSVNSL